MVVTTGEANDCNENSLPLFNRSDDFFFAGALRVSGTLDEFDDFVEW